jgi:hypothetical protein
MLESMFGSDEDDEHAALLPNATSAGNTHPRDMNAPSNTTPLPKLRSLANDRLRPRVANRNALLLDLYIQPARLRKRDPVRKRVAEHADRHDVRLPWDGSDFDAAAG